MVKAGGRDGLAVCWTRKFLIEGGPWYRFNALRRAMNVSNPRRSGPVRISWLDKSGRKAMLDKSETKTLRPGAIGPAEPAYPEDGPASAGG